MCLAIKSNMFQFMAEKIPPPGFVEKENLQELTEAAIFLQFSASKFGMCMRSYVVFEGGIAATSA